MMTFLKKIFKYVLAFVSGIITTLFIANNFSKKQEDNKKYEIKEQKEQLEKMDAETIVNDNANPVSVDADIGTIRDEFRKRIRDRLHTELYGETSDTDDSHNP